MIQFVFPQMKRNVGATRFNMYMHTHRNRFRNFLTYGIHLYFKNVIHVKQPCPVNHAHLAYFFSSALIYCNTDLLLEAMLLRAVCITQCFQEQTCLTLEVKLVWKISRLVCFHSCLTFRYRDFYTSCLHFSVCKHIILNKAKVARKYRSCLGSTLQPHKQILF